MGLLYWTLYAVRGIFDILDFFRTWLYCHLQLIRCRRIGVSVSVPPNIQKRPDSSRIFTKKYNSNKTAATRL